jgi:hypothetical protein
MVKAVVENAVESAEEVPGAKGQHGFCPSCGREKLLRKIQIIIGLFIRSDLGQGNARRKSLVEGNGNLHRFAAGMLRKSTTENPNKSLDLVTRKYRIWGSAEGLGATLTP